jgi:hypothetical protein
MGDRIFTEKIQIKVVELLDNGKKIIKYFDIDPDFFGINNPTEDSPTLKISGLVKHKGEFEE